MPFLTRSRENLKFRQFFIVMGEYLMKYTAKDVCKIYHVNRETLRYYERIGLIRPEIDESN